MGLTEDDVIERIVSTTTRFGPRIQLHQVGTVPATPLEEHVLPKIENEIAAENRRHGGQRTPKLINLEAKARVLRITRGLKSRLGRRPTVFQVLAVPAIQYGLDSEELDTMSRVMITTYTDHRDQVTWEGSPSNIRVAIKVDRSSRHPCSRINIPLETERLLFRERERGLDTHEIAAGIGIKPTRRSLKDINTGCQLLETAGFIRKQPPHSIPGVTGGSRSVWSHRAYRNPFPRHPNSKLDVQEALFQWSEEGGRGHPTTLLTTEFGDQYTNHPILRAVGYLKKAGLVTTTSETITRISDSGGTAVLTEVSLTPQAICYLTRMHRERSLPEGFRKLLLGEKTP